MASVLVDTGEESITVTASAARRLLERGDGDAALLYLALLRHRGTVPPRALAGELRWERSRIEAAEESLRQLGLIAPAETPPEPAEERPDYRQADIADRLEGSEEFRQLTDQVEKRLGTRLTVPGVGVLLELWDHLGLPTDVIYQLVCHCAERTERRLGPGRRPGMKEISREGYRWASRGIDSQSSAVAYLRQYARRQEAVPAYMHVLGLGDRAPSVSEERYLTAWQEQGFPPESVALAYDKTMLKCHDLKWAYLNGILKRWHEAGLHTVEEIEAGDRPGGQKSTPAASGGTAAPARTGSGGDTAWMRKLIQQRNGG